MSERAAAVASPLSAPLHVAAATALPPRSATSAPALHLHIDRLVLDGFPPLRGGEAPLHAAMVTELERLFANGEVAAELRGGVAMPRLSLKDLSLPHDIGADHLGRHIAQALHRGLGR
jgi:hypothetical protein